jgi:hypothetical protein
MSTLQRAWAIARREVDADVILLALAVGLIAVGFWQWWRPGAFLIPGLVMLWIALPCRTSFIVQTDHSADERLTATGRQDRQNGRWKK